MTMNEEQTIRVLPVLPLRGLTAFPEMLIHFDVGRIMSIKALEAAMKDGQNIFLTAQKELKTDTPHAEDLFEIGTICVIKQILRMPGDNIRVLVEGQTRARVRWSLNPWRRAAACMPRSNCWRNIVPMRRTVASRRLFARCRIALPNMPIMRPVCRAMSCWVSPRAVNRAIWRTILPRISRSILQVKQEILEELNVTKRLTRVIRLLTDETEILKIESDIQDELKEQIDKNQREYYLREQIKVIQSELGEQDVSAEVDEYRDKIEALELPQEHTEKLLKEADRLSKMSSTSAESGVIRTYLDTVLDLPWKQTTKEQH